MNNKKIRKETLNEISRIVNELVGEGGDGGATVKVLDTIEAAIHTVWNSLDGEAGLCSDICCALLLSSLRKSPLVAAIAETDPGFAMAIHSVCNRIMADSIKMLLALISANNDMNERDGTNASLLDEGRSLKVSEFIKEKAE